MVKNGKVLFLWGKIRIILFILRRSIVLCNVGNVSCLFSFFLFLCLYVACGRVVVLGFVGREGEDLGFFIRYHWVSLKSHLSSQVSSIDTVLTLGARGCEFESSQYQCSRENLSVLEIPFTANCLVETRTKLEELIPSELVKYGLNRVQLPLWLQQSLFNGFSWYGLSCGPQWSAKCAEAEWNYKGGRIVHFKLPAFFLILFMCVHNTHQKLMTLYLYKYLP